MNQRELIFGLYHTTDTINGTYDFEQVYQQVYRPILTLLYEFPRIRTTLYIPGSLIQWFDKVRPEITMLLLELNSRRQLEFLSGGRYDPYLAQLPPKDRVGQVEVMTTMVRRQFKTRTRGVYLAGQLWSTTLIQSLDSCGIDYTFINDSPMQKFVGPTKRGGLAPFRVEQQGKFLTVFPVFRTLCQELYQGGGNNLFDLVQRTMPRQPVSLLLDVKKLQSVDNLPQIMKAFFEQITYSDSVTSILPREYIRNNPHIRLAYLPEGWYDNNTEWRFPQDGVIHVPEANLFYGKMQFAHTMIGKPKQDKSRKKSATNLLYKAQNHAFYVAEPEEKGIAHRLFRHQGQSLLIEVDKMLRGTATPHKLAKVDLNHDGRSEYYYRGELVNTHVDSVGGSICGLEYIPKPWNYGSTFGQGTIPEGSTLAKQHLRRSFTDYITPMGSKFEPQLFAGKLGGITTSAFTAYTEEEYDRDSCKVKLTSEMHLPRDPHASIQACKEYRFTSSGGTVTYQLKNTSLQPKQFNFLIEFNIAFNHNNKQGLEIIPISPEEPKGNWIQGFLCNDYHNSACISVNSTQGAKLWQRHAKDHHGNYQHTTLYLSYTILIEPDEIWVNPLGFVVENLLKSVKK